MDQFKFYIFRVFKFKKPGVALSLKKSYAEDIFVGNDATQRSGVVQEDAIRTSSLTDIGSTLEKRLTKNSSFPQVSFQPSNCDYPIKTSKQTIGKNSGSTNVQKERSAFITLIDDDFDSDFIPTRHSGGILSSQNPKLQKVSN